MKNETDLEGFEPPTFGLEARRYILAKPQVQIMCPMLLSSIPHNSSGKNGGDPYPAWNATGRTTSTILGSIIEHRFTLALMVELAKNFNLHRAVSFSRSIM